MKVLLTGGTGFVGNEVGRKLSEQGHDLVVLTRNVETAGARLSYPAKVFQWSGKGRVSAQALEGVEAVVNLMGEGIADAP